MIEFINQMPLAGLMLATSLGFMLGRLQFRQMSMGPAGGTLFAALAFGYCGVNLDLLYGEGPRHLTVGTLGFVLFIYSIGFEAGPRFFSSIRTRNGWKFITMAIVVNALAVVLCLGWGKLFQLDAATTAGMLSGALTSAPTYAAASQAGLDNTRLSVAFAIAYPIGLVGLVVILQTLPRFLHQNLAAETTGDVETHGLVKSPEISRAFEVTRPQVFDQKLRDLKLTTECGVVLTQIFRSGRLIIPEADTKLMENDHLIAVGRLRELQKLELLIGVEIELDELHERLPPLRKVTVMEPTVASKTLADLNLIQRFHCIVTGIERGTEVVEPAADVTLLRNDVVLVAGARQNVQRLADEMGVFEPDINETNIAIYTGGIFMGLLIGSFHLHPLGLDFSLGLAGGLLIAGLCLGWLGRIGRYSTHVPKPAQQLVRDLGILLFIGETGLEAGGNLMEGLSIAPWQTIVGAACVMTITVVGTLLVGLKILRLKSLDSWGSVCGGLTSSAALQALRSQAHSNEVTISYAAAYAVGSVAATMAGQLIAIWLT
ncbi:MAG: aspartate:alanine exchanger family transporter [Limisphaerales bacterium]